MVEEADTNSGTPITGCQISKNTQYPAVQNRISRRPVIETSPNNEAAGYLIVPTTCLAILP